MFAELQLFGIKFSRPMRIYGLKIAGFDASCTVYFSDHLKSTKVQMRGNTPDSMR